MAGRLVTTLRDAVMPAGRYSVEWDGTDARGRSVASGIYFAEMHASAYRKVARLVLVK